MIDSPTFNPNGVHKELTAKAASLAIQNEKLQSEVTKVQSDCYNLERKKRILTDKLSVQENRVQELEHQLEDARFETDKHMRLANKFEYKLATLVSEGQSGGNGGATPSSSGTTNATEKKISAPDIPPSETAAKEVRFKNFLSIEMNNAFLKNNFRSKICVLNEMNRNPLHHDAFKISRR